MKTVAHLFLGALLALALSACNTAEKYAKNNAATAQWIDANAGSPSTNVTGRWHSDDWGDAYLSQKGNRVTGYIGKYPVGGSVKGHSVYLALTEDGWTYYTVVAQRPQKNVIAGFYSDSVPFVPADQSPFQLLRIDP